MKCVIAMYGKPEDPQAFAQHYENVHTPLVQQMPHLKRFEVTSAPILAGEAESGAHLVAVMGYETQEDLEASLGSPEGQAAVADLENFATGGCQVFTTEIASALR